MTGVSRVSVNLVTEKADILYDGPAVREAMVAAIRATGYDVAAETFEIGIEGMTCASCVVRVERALASVSGVVSAAVNLATERPTLRVNGASGAVTAQVEAAIRRAGYQPRLVRPGVEHKAALRGAEQAKLKRDLIIAGTLTLPIFILEMGSHALPALHHWLGRSGTAFITSASPALPRLCSLARACGSIEGAFPHCCGLHPT